MTQLPMDKKPTRAVIINGACVVLAVVGLALVSNRLLDMAGIANEQAMSVDERKEKAQNNQDQWEQTSWQERRSSGVVATKMCGDSDVLTKVKKLINDQTPNIGKLSEAVRNLDASRVGGLDAVIRAREEEIRKTKEAYQQNPIDPNSRYVGNPVQERAKHLADLETDLNRLRAKQAEEANRPKPKIQITENEIILTSAATPVEFDPTTNRAACKVTYKVNGMGYDNPGVQMSTADTALYTIQQAGDDWIINLVSLN